MQELHLVPEHSKLHSSCKGYLGEFIEDLSPIKLRFCQEIQELSIKAIGIWIVEIVLNLNIPIFREAEREKTSLEQGRPALMGGGGEEISIQYLSPYT